MFLLSESVIDLPDGVYDGTWHQGKVMIVLDNVVHSVPTDHVLVSVIPEPWKFKVINGYVYSVASQWHLVQNQLLLNGLESWSSDLEYSLILNAHSLEYDFEPVHLLKSAMDYTFSLEGYRPWFYEMVERFLSQDMKYIPDDLLSVFCKYLNKNIRVFNRERADIDTYYTLRFAVFPGTVAAAWSPSDKELRLNLGSAEFQGLSYLLTAGLKGAIDRELVVSKCADLLFNTLERHIVHEFGHQTQEAASKGRHRQSKNYKRYADARDVSYRDPKNTRLMKDRNSKYLLVFQEMQARAYQDAYTFVSTIYSQLKDALTGKALNVSDFWVSSLFISRYLDRRCEVEQTNFDLANPELSDAANAYTSSRDSSVNTYLYDEFENTLLPKFRAELSKFIYYFLQSYHINVQDEGPADLRLDVISLLSGAVLDPVKVSNPVVSQGDFMFVHGYKGLFSDRKILSDGKRVACSGHSSPNFSCSVDYFDHNDPYKLFLSQLELGYSFKELDTSIQSAVISFLQTIPVFDLSLIDFLDVLCHHVSVFLGKMSLRPTVVFQSIDSINVSGRYISDRVNDVQAIIIYVQPSDIKGSYNNILNNQDLVSYRMDLAHDLIILAKASFSHEYVHVQQDDNSFGKYTDDYLSKQYHAVNKQIMDMQNAGIAGEELTIVERQRDDLYYQLPYEISAEAVQRARDFVSPYFEQGIKSIPRDAIDRFMSSEVASFISQIPSERIRIKVKDFYIKQLGRYIYLFIQQFGLIAQGLIVNRQEYLSSYLALAQWLNSQFTTMDPAKVANPVVLPLGSRKPKKLEIPKVLMWGEQQHRKIANNLPSGWQYDFSLFDEQDFSELLRDRERVLDGGVTQDALVNDTLTSWVSFNFNPLVYSIEIANKYYIKHYVENSVLVCRVWPDIRLLQGVCMGSIPKLVQAYTDYQKYLYSKLSLDSQLFIQSQLQFIEAAKSFIR